jgi:hypothetical protein
MAGDLKPKHLTNDEQVAIERHPLGVPKARALKSLNESGTSPTLAATRSAK